MRISNKHGLNPTIGICAWCGEETGLIGLAGKLPNDEEAPKYSVLSYDPCDKCKEMWDKGVAIIEVVPTTAKEEMIAKGVKPTGRYVVIKPQALAGHYKAGQRLLMHSEEYAPTFGKI